MTNVNLRLPDSTHEAAVRKAKQEGESLNAFIVRAVTAQLASTGEADRYFELRAGRAKPGALLEVLGKVRNTLPRDGDEVA
ncbi:MULTISPECIES: YlcI/YnfO family protein [Nitrospirillum]|uniref:Toxin-antitoxin system HicB family antitoxin n=2 Tax=Nitrospirillum TaxID=1543705 RepID=A0A248JR74_9PROT|nr:YlcI/YnfO family protein [Nitrospirillum amazonense]ASG21207.1 toxin-antitoxin system HicB family antitoxin [Nitrospirillum amazonense CBAmc]MEC4592428.1 YlcI/YnfO family protein [Nitrospirillum amazonense]TWB26895.1 HicB-like protein involved in pilus formation [Nitrospirillum amazonense]TWB32200.1 HicB-like protein involved in pilus formation [Nitrospirillum amazonense]